MTPKNCSYAIFLTLNILFFAIVSANGNCPTPPKPKPTPPKPKPCPTPSNGKCPTPPKPKPCPTPPNGKCPTPPKPKPTPKPTPSRKSCPRDTIKLGGCSSVLNGMFNFSMGVPNGQCCGFLDGLVDYDFAICICTALKANIMGIIVNIPISFTQLINFCSRQAPSGFECLPDIH
ncbi:putative bifunctional inhibitor/plant lipid transfer protein/seed storage helical [Medicago truncatula]|uniref:Lipid transfer protein n=1 Tax=Medicago truncatula TaxID=3880 RepID=G7JW15_MEDTR|nr:Lipid transfer protein [Medicago truncatula]RHN53738.1 putative bifunctional inhibitor/plant lipid transfer protein/seed storage helical [Medicago truncatula]